MGGWAGFWLGLFLGGAILAHALITEKAIREVGVALAQILIAMRRELRSTRNILRRSLSDRGGRLDLGAGDDSDSLADNLGLDDEP